MNKKVVFWVIVIICIIAIAVCSAILFIKNQENSNSTFLGTEVVNGEEQNQNTIVAEEETVEIFKGNSRPIAVMIDNNKNAMPQAGLNDAYMVYEIIVEGGESRLMALSKDADLDVIGPVRSARHYFVDFALENDAIYVHFGESPQAQSDIGTYNVNDIDGIKEDGSTFWRVRDKRAPHNAVTSMENLLKSAQKKDYRTTSSKESVLNYVTEEITLDEGQIAQNVTIPYSQSNVVKWTYDETIKKYKRASKSIEQKDWTTGENVTAKNIIVEFIANTTLADGENKGRQTMNTTGIKDGYYITNGMAIPIKCEKVSRSSQTVYKDLEGNEIKVNDGNTFVQICPINAKVVIE